MVQLLSTQCIALVTSGQQNQECVT